MSSLFQALQNRDIRQLGIHPNYWYVVALSSNVANRPVTIWQQAIALYRIKCLLAIAQIVCNHILHQAQTTGSRGYAD